MTFGAVKEKSYDEIKNDKVIQTVYTANTTALPAHKRVSFAIKRFLFKELRSKLKQKPKLDITGFIFTRIETTVF